MADARTLLADQLTLHEMLGTLRPPAASAVDPTRDLASSTAAALEFAELQARHSTPDLAEYLLLTLPREERHAWRVDEHFQVLGDEPLNKRPDGSMEGACALLFRVRHARSGRALVLKVMLSFRQDASLQGEAHELPDLLLRLHNGIFRLPQLSPHLHVVPVLHHFVGDMTPFAPHVHDLMRPHLAERTLCVVMPEFPGSLQRVLEKVSEHGVGWVSECKAAKLLMQLLLAVRHLQAHHEAHCDIKPDNVLLDPGTWHAVLTGCNCSRKLVTSSGRPVPLSSPQQLWGGNMLTCAPEVKRLLHLPPSQLADEGLTLVDAFGKAAEFACGATLLLTLLGDNGSLFGDTGAAGWRAPVLPARNYSAGFRAVVQQLLAVNPADRLDATSAVLMLGLLLWQRELVPSAGAPGGVDTDAGEPHAQHDAMPVDTVLRQQFVKVAQEAALGRHEEGTVAALSAVGERLEALIHGLQAAAA